MRVLHDNVLVRPIEEAKVSAGGILLPNAVTTTKTVRGVVEGVGDGVTNQKTGEITPLDVKEGDTVLFRSDAGIKVGALVFLKEQDISAILNQ